MGSGFGMKCVVTGAAGFIGSHLCEALLNQGHEVRGVDALIPYYSPAAKERNTAVARVNPRYSFHRLDLRHDPLEGVLDGANVVLHLAGMPGLSQSWADFDGYSTCNVSATQRLLEAVSRQGSRPRRLIYASTSSVYGREACGDESLP